MIYDMNEDKSYDISVPLDFSGIIETIYLMNIPGMRESLIEGMNTPVEETDEDPGW
jgi:hypothetical protein